MASSVRPIATNRVTMLMQSSLMMSSINSTSTELMDVQAQLSSGLKILRPSDDPSGATVVMSLDSQLERQNSYLGNIQFVGNYLDTVDSSLQEATDLVNEAYNLALTSVGDTVSDSARQANAIMIDAIVDQLVNVSNQTNYGTYIFGGQNATEQPFSNETGGIMYTGNTDQKMTKVNDDNLTYFSVQGDEVFGSLSSEVVGITDLDPSVTGDTLLADLNGTLERGIRKGSIGITIGTDYYVVDLKEAVTVNDVINMISDQTSGLVTAAVKAAPADGLELTSTTPLADLNVKDIGSGTVAKDLGINTNGTAIVATAAGAVLSGDDINPKITTQTLVTSLNGGAGIDLSSGIIIKNSLMADVNPIAFDSCETVGDMLNLINRANIGARAEINEYGDGINIINQLSGSQMSIAENGGTTAEDLGIRSFTGTSLISAFNNGEGVNVEDGEIEITAANGAVYNVGLDGAATVQDVLDKINAVTGGVVVASLPATGNGFVLTDNSGGAGNMTVTTSSTNNYDVAYQLGISTAREDITVTGNVLNGADVNTVQPDGIFSHLLALRDALLKNDNAAITSIGEQIASDRDQIINVNGIVGSMGKSIEQRETYMQDNILATKTLRSDIRDVDYTDAITRYYSLYTALEASYSASSSQNQMSLLDYL